MFEVPKSASPEGFRGTHRALGFFYKESIVKEFCSNVILYHYNTLLVEESQSAVSPPEAFWTSALLGPQT